MDSEIKTFDIFAPRGLTCIKLVYTNNAPFASLGLNKCRIYTC